MWMIVSRAVRCNGGPGGSPLHPSRCCRLDLRRSPRPENRTIPSQAGPHSGSRDPGMTMGARINRIVRSSRNRRGVTRPRQALRKPPARPSDQASHGPRAARRHGRRLSMPRGGHSSPCPGLDPPRGGGIRASTGLPRASRRPAGWPKNPTWKTPARPWSRAGRNRSSPPSPAGACPPP